MTTIATARIAALGSTRRVRSFRATPPLLHRMPDSVSPLSHPSPSATAFHTKLV
jgi:hypothetical protein